MKTRAVKGRITANWLIQCGGVFCDKATTARVETVREAELNFLSKGWVETANGWVCRECADKIKSDPEAIIPGLKHFSRGQLAQARRLAGDELAAARVNNASPAVIASHMERIKIIEAEVNKRLLNRIESEFT